VALLNQLVQHSDLFSTTYHLPFFGHWLDDCSWISLINHNNHGKKISDAQEMFLSGAIESSIRKRLILTKENHRKAQLI